MKFDNWWKLEEFLKDEVGKLNRMIYQHPKSIAFPIWVAMKEWIEIELLGYKVEYRT